MHPFITQHTHVIPRALAVSFAARPYRYFASFALAFHSIHRYFDTSHLSFPNCFRDQVLSSLANERNSPIISKLSIASSPLPQEFTKFVLLFF